MPAKPFSTVWIGLLPDLWSTVKFINSARTIPDMRRVPLLYVCNAMAFLQKKKPGSRERNRASLTAFARQCGATVI